MVPHRFILGKTIVIISFLLNQPHVNALSTASNIKIVGLPTGVQYLPSSYAKNFPRWSLDGPSSSPLQPLDGTTPSSSSSFVNPTSTTEIWWPSDLTHLQVRPTLDVFLQNGIPTYALAGLEVRVPSHASKDKTVWKNYGMNSQPLAKQWTSFGNLITEKEFRVEAFLGTKLVETKHEEGVMKWRRLEDVTSCRQEEEEEQQPSSAILSKEKRIAQSAQRTSDAINTIGQVLAGLDQSSPLADGRHIISAPVQDWMDLPPLNEDRQSYKLMCVATAEPDAKQLLNSDDGLMEMTASSVLDVDVLSVSSGSESEYLPEVYKPLYLDE